MMAVWKFQVRMDAFTVQMPKDAVILHVGVQRGIPQMWALCDPDNAFGEDQRYDERYFTVVGTGQGFPTDLDFDMKHIGTFMLHNDTFVGHLFELVEKEKT